MEICTFLNRSIFFVEFLDLYLSDYCIESHESVYYLVKMASGMTLSILGR